MAVQKRRVFRLGKELKEMKDWLSRPGQQSFQWVNSRKNIASALASPNERTVTAFRAELGQLHAWKSTQGAVSVLEGKTTGWKDLCHGLAFACCDVQIAFGMFMDRGLPKQGALCDVELPLVLASAIALHHDNFADWCGRILVDSYRSGKGAFRDWKLTPLSAFVTLLYTRWRKVDVSKPAVVRKLGVYEGLFRHWDDLKKLLPAITKACDFHVANSEYTESRVTEFEESPYDVFPVEILAYQRVRDELGLQTTMPDHPLLDTPMTQVPDRHVPFKDELLDLIQSFLHRELPSTKG